MRINRLFIGLKAALAILALILLVTSTWADAQEKVLHSFNRNNGAAPTGLIFDATGNLYGTANAGGAHGCGTVYELIPKAGRGWTEKVLHNFHGPDGVGPGANLIFDAAGNLYGTTFYGGVRGDGTGVRVVTPNGRKLDGEGAAQFSLRAQGRRQSYIWRDLRCRRKSLWHDSVRGDRGHGV
jgi:uncharacterized repeat protein (TIGR03803 family)